MGYIVMAYIVIQKKRRKGNPSLLDGYDLYSYAVYSYGLYSQSLYRRRQERGTRACDTQGGTRHHPQACLCACLMHMPHARVLTRICTRFFTHVYTLMHVHISITEGGTQYSLHTGAHTRSLLCPCLENNVVGHNCIGIII